MMLSSVKRPWVHGPVALGLKNYDWDWIKVIVEEEDLGRKLCSSKFSNCVFLRNEEDSL